MPNLPQSNALAAASQSGQQLDPPFVSCTNCRRRRFCCCWPQTLLRQLFPVPLVMAELGRLPLSLEACLGRLFLLHRPISVFMAVAQALVALQRSLVYREGQLHAVITSWLSNRACWWRYTAIIAKDFHCSSEDSSWMNAINELGQNCSTK